MALKWHDRILETSTTTGTGALTLAGAVTGFKTFASRLSTNDTCYYSIEGVDAGGTPTGEWETGLGTYSGVNTLTRTTVLESSNADAAVNFSAGTKRVMLTKTAAPSTKASTTDILTGTDDVKEVTADALAALWEKGADIASAGTISVGEGGTFHVTGTTTITDIDPATDKAGRFFILIFDGALTLTHNASTLILPGAANITTAAGDSAIFVSEGSDAVRCVSYNKASGQPVKFSGALVYINSALTPINATAGYDVPFATANAAEEYDTDGYHDLTTNTTRLTAPVAGYYYITGTLFYTGGTSADYYRLKIKKNGADFVGMPFQTGEISSTIGVGVNLHSAAVFLAANDYVEMNLQVESDTSISISATITSFSIRRVG